MLASHQLGFVPLDELEQLVRDKQCELQSLYTPAMFEGVPIRMSAASGPTGSHARGMLHTVLSYWLRRFTRAGGVGEVA